MLDNDGRRGFDQSIVCYQRFAKMIAFCYSTWQVVIATYKKIFQYFKLNSLGFKVGI